MLSSQSGRVPNPNFMRTNLQLCLEYLDRLIDCRETMKIRALITEVLGTIPIVMDFGTRDNDDHLQAMFDHEHQDIATDELNAMLPLVTALNLSGLPQPLAHGRFSDQEYGPLEYVEAMGLLPKDTNPMIYQHPKMLCSATPPVVLALSSVHNNLSKATLR
ncbi:hypothetical protein BDR07DRAFT_1609050 [Suillus spraguei]|nr:hypothetical protein BDR07DRAFT_1609050 [Suillus spraguei]